MKTTNYYNTFIEVAEDCPVKSAEIPPLRGDKKTVARMQYETVIDHPYEYTSDDVIFSVFASRKEIPGHKMDEQRRAFFSKGQPCFRSSPLTKRYGWGVHSNEEGRIAIYPIESGKYSELTADKNLEHTKAMRSKRK